MVVSGGGIALVVDAIGLSEDVDFGVSEAESDLPDLPGATVVERLGVAVVALTAFFVTIFATGGGIALITF